MFYFILKKCIYSAIDPRSSRNVCWGAWTGGFRRFSTIVQDYTYCSRSQENTQVHPTEATFPLTMRRFQQSDSCVDNVGTSPALGRGLELSWCHSYEMPFDPVIMNCEDRIRLERGYLTRRFWFMFAMQSSAILTQVQRWNQIRWNWSARLFLETPCVAPS